MATLCQPRATWLLFSIPSDHEVSWSFHLSVWLQKSQREMEAPRPIKVTWRSSIERNPGGLQDVSSSKPPHASGASHQICLQELPHHPHQDHLQITYRPNPVEKSLQNTTEEKKGAF